MEGKLGISRWRWWKAMGSAKMVGNQKHDHGLRFMTQKASNRAAVHGVKRPINEEMIDEEKVEEEIKKGKEEKERKWKEVEDKINSQHKSNQDCNK